MSAAGFAPNRDDHLMTIALTARVQRDRDVKPLAPGAFWETCADLDGHPSGAADSDSEQLRRLADRRSLAALHGAELEEQGISLLTPFHPDYPERLILRLGTQAPPLLYLAGDPRRLAQSDSNRLGVVGSRDATAEELESARRAAEAAVESGWEVVSGGAKGVDAEALNAAAGAGGFVLAVLPDGVRRAVRKGALRKVIAGGGGIVLSPTHPDAPFSVGAAMGRNKLIYALADRTFVASATEGSGGTWAGATEAIRRAYGVVAVLDGGVSEGLQALAGLGAETAAQTADLVGSPTGSPAPVDDEAQQATLFSP